MLPDCDASARGVAQTIAANARLRATFSLMARHATYLGLCRSEIGKGGIGHCDLIIAGINVAGLVFAFTMRRSGTANSSNDPTIQEMIGQLRDQGAWMDSGMQSGPVDELLDVAVECLALDQLEVEIGRTLEDRVITDLTGDHWEERHMDAVDQAGAHQRPVHRQTAVRA
jgi:hypothetical protein